MKSVYLSWGEMGRKLTRRKTQLIVKASGLGFELRGVFVGRWLVGSRSTEWDLTQEDKKLEEVIRLQSHAKYLQSW